MTTQRRLGRRHVGDACRIVSSALRGPCHESGQTRARNATTAAVVDATHASYLWVVVDHGTNPPSPLAAAAIPADAASDHLVVYIPPSEASTALFPVSIPAFAVAPLFSNSPDVPKRLTGAAQNASN